ncbi:hypothetical protein M9Y10_023669 [Tritrichomonas musculus]|uniref:IQ calmodulin-binding motif family protein n=1 Tax=Tritrichomonas musculus TaxID=1915356 RepID=A0ABR2KWD0_9EUKA
MEIIIQRRQVAERKEKLDQLTNSVKATEDLIFDLMKETTPITVYTEKNYMRLKDEDSKIREILSISDPKADICQEFNNVVKRRMREIKKRNAQAEELKHKLDSIKCEMENTGLKPQQFKHSDTRRYIKGTLNKYMIEIRGLKEFINDSKTNFSKCIEDMRKQFKSQFINKKQTEIEIVNKMDEYNSNLADQLEELEKQRDDLSKELSNLKNNPQTKKPIQTKYDPEQKIQNFKDILIRRKWKLQNIYDQIKKFKFKFNLLSDINLKIDDIEARIDSIIKKIKQGEAIIRKNRKRKEKKLLKKRELNAQMNFLSLMRVGRLGMTVQKIAKNMEPWYENQTKQLKAKMKEKSEPKIDINGKQMTASELRKEIMRIEKINAEESYKNEIEIRKLEQEQENYIKLTQEIYSHNKS